MASGPSKLRVAFIHPDLGIGGAERLVVDAALGLQKLGHDVVIYTSYHDPGHCFDETRDGTLKIRHIVSPFPRSFKGKFHSALAHARQLHLTKYLIQHEGSSYDIYFVDILSTCVPILRLFTGVRVAFYCHFPDKLLANGAYVEGKMKKGGLLKQLYRLPMDWLEERTTGSADIIFANSKFTSRVFKLHLPSIEQTPRVVYPGINLAAYEPQAGRTGDPDVAQVTSDRPTFVSINRFEAKKNAMLAVEAFSALRTRLANKENSNVLKNARLVISGGYDPRVEDNIMTLAGLIDRAKSSSLTFDVIKPPGSNTNIPPFVLTPENPDIIFLLNFTTPQRATLLSAPSTVALLYTPTNEHFGIGPVEAMVCGLPVLACDSGGPTESVLDEPAKERTGWLRHPDPEVWAAALEEIISMSPEERSELGKRSQARARENFGMEAMAKALEHSLTEVVALGRVPTPTWVYGLVAAVMLLIAYIVGLIFQ
ncbi:mannosyltransferase [Dentipellis sp. KUC8613]|nr:mannosyltransferase [Dentipellis sp. KUC8613]